MLVRTCVRTYAASLLFLADWLLCTVQCTVLECRVVYLLKSKVTPLLRYSVLSTSSLLGNWVLYSVRVLHIPVELRQMQIDPNRFKSTQIDSGLFVLQKIREEISILVVNSTLYQACMKNVDMFRIMSTPWERCNQNFDKEHLLIYMHARPPILR